MRFQVPQFIEVESKIFGPLTIRQFVYLAGGAGIIFLLYAFLPFFLTVLFGVPVAALSLALAFYKINNQPFIKIVESALRYGSSPKVYVWKKREVAAKPGEEKKEKPAPAVYVPKMTKSKLKELAWSLDIKEKTR